MNDHICQQDANRTGKIEDSRKVLQNFSNLKRKFFISLKYLRITDVLSDGYFTPHN